MIATVTSYDAEGEVSHVDTRYYPDSSLLWEHIGCQQNNRRTVRVVAKSDTGLQCDVRFGPWTEQRRFSPSRRFRALLQRWAAEEIL